VHTLCSTRRIPSVSCSAPLGSPREVFGPKDPVQARCGQILVRLFPHSAARKEPEGYISRAWPWSGAGKPPTRKFPGTAHTTRRLHPSLSPAADVCLWAPAVTAGSPGASARRRHGGGQTKPAAEVHVLIGRLVWPFPTRGSNPAGIPPAAGRRPGDGDAGTCTAQGGSGRDVTDVGSAIGLCFIDVLGSLHLPAGLRRS